jgi:hypothetical protein
VRKRAVTTVLFHLYILTSVTPLSADNKLSGTIPSDFLQSLSTRKPVEVDLSSNKLKGRIPTDLDR